MKAIAILRGSLGGPCSDHAVIDPCPPDLHWSEFYTNGGDYHGILEIVNPLSSDTPETFERRVSARADELDRQLHCSRCYRDE